MNKCKIEGCNNQSKGYGLCNSHYMRLYRYGNPLYEPQHHKTNSPEYTTWRAMINRCEREDHKNYKHYGGRGIIVCHRWRDSFKMFYSDMGPKPFRGAQIDRINNDGNYEPRNCRWVTCTENNRRSSKIKLSLGIAREIRRNYKNSDMSQSAFAKLYNTDQSTISRIIHKKLWREDGTAN